MSTPDFTRWNRAGRTISMTCVSDFCNGFRNGKHWKAVQHLMKLQMSGLHVCSNCIMRQGGTGHGKPAGRLRVHCIS